MTRLPKQRRLAAPWSRWSFRDGHGHPASLEEAAPERRAARQAPAPDPAPLSLSDAAVLRAIKRSPSGSVTEVARLLDAAPVDVLRKIEGNPMLREALSDARLLIGEAAVDANNALIEAGSARAIGLAYEIGRNEQEKRDKEREKLEQSGSSTFELHFAVCVPGSVIMEDGRVLGQEEARQAWLDENPRLREHFEGASTYAEDRAGSPRPESFDTTKDGDQRESERRKLLQRLGMDADE